MKTKLIIPAWAATLAAVSGAQAQPALQAGQAVPVAIVRAGDPAPGGGMFSSFPEVSTSGDGRQLTFRASVRFGVQVSRGLFQISGGALRLLAHAGDPAPGGGTFNFFYSPVVNINGQVAFRASLLNPSGTGIFLSQADGTVTAVARQGDPSPAGGRFDFSFAFSSANRHRAVTRDSAFRLERISASERVTRPKAVAGPEGLGDGEATFSYFSLPLSINDTGDVAFAARTSVFGRGGVFVFSNGRLTRRIRELDPVAGGGTIVAVNQVSLNAVGQIAFQAYLSASFNDHGLFLFSPDGTVTPIARFGQPSPDGDSFTYLSSPSLNAVGQVAFTSELVDSLGGVYLWSGDSIARVAGHGDVIDREPKFIEAFPQAIDGAGRVLFSADLFPGSYGLFLGLPTAVIARVGERAPGGGVFDFVSSNAPAMSDSGQAVFVADTTPYFRNGLHSSSNGMLSRIAVNGDPAPGGGTFFYFGSVSINTSGEVAFVGLTSFPSRSGLYLFSDPDFRSLLALGDPAPGGGTFSDFPFLSLNNQLRVAFAASVTAPGQPGIFRWSQDMVTAIAQTGDPAPGGGTFDFPAPASSFYAPSLNSSGDVAFGALVFPSGDSGVFKFSGGDITSVASPGDAVPRTGTIIFADTASLNDAGQVSFYAQGTVSSGACLFSERTRSALALAGDPAPGGGTFDYVDVPFLNARTQVGFVGGLPEGTAVFLANPIR